MFQISNNFNIKFQNETIKKQDNRFKNSSPQSDVFQKSQDISFKGLQGLFLKDPKSVPQIEVLSGVSDDFVSRITRQISQFPSDWLKKIKDENYKIILAPNLSDAYESQRVFDPVVENFEEINPKGTLAVTYSQRRPGGKNFFVFCDKQPHSDKYMGGIVNHELSHGVVNILSLDKNEKTLGLIKKDVDLIIKERKLDKLTLTERCMVSRYFFNSKAHVPIDEIVADVYAWNKGQGCYGSGLVMDAVNPKLMTNLFPNLSEYLKSI